MGRVAFVGGQSNRRDAEGLDWTGLAGAERQHGSEAELMGRVKQMSGRRIIGPRDEARRISTIWCDFESQKRTMP